MPSSRLRTLGNLPEFLPRRMSCSLVVHACSGARGKRTGVEGKGSCSWCVDGVGGPPLFPFVSPPTRRGYPICFKRPCLGMYPAHTRARTCRISDDRQRASASRKSSEYPPWAGRYPGQPSPSLGVLRQLCAGTVR